MRPFALEGAASLAALVPVALAGRRSAHDQLADLALAQLAAVLVHDLGVVAGHRLAGRAITHVAGTVAEERLQHLGRADAVENVDADLGAPPLAELGRQRFAGRRAYAQPVRADA